MDALRAAAGTITVSSDDGCGIVALVPTIVAAYWRLRRNAEPFTPRDDLGHTANFLYMLSGKDPDAEHVRALETYLNTVIDHGLNASTFTARVITSTGSDLVSAVVGAIGALKGPLHGGAPGPALDMVFEIGEASRAEAFLRKKLEAGEKLMGFGHRVYRVRDPRADVLAAAAERLYTRAGDMAVYMLTRAVEATALRLLADSKCRCSRRRSRSAVSVAGSLTRSSSEEPIGSSARSPSTPDPETGNGSRCRIEPTGR
jgi:citrate synthase